MQVGREIHGCREDTLVLFTFGFTVKLLPPFAYVVQFGVEVYKDFNLLAVLVEFIAGGCIDSCRVFSERNILSASLFHSCRACYQFFDVEACNGDGQQTYRGEYGETAAYVIGDNERFVSFIVCGNACCAFLGVCNGNDHLFGHLLAALVFALFFQQAEGQSRFGSGSRFGNIDDTEFLVFQIFGKLVQIIFTDVVSCIQNNRTGLLVLQPCETV